MATKLIAVRRPTQHERSKHHAEVVFVRQDEHGREVKVYGARCYESWEQWGAQFEVLCENVTAIERWRHREGVEL